MAVKQVPTNFRVYYKSMHNTFTLKAQNIRMELDNIIADEKLAYNELKSNLQEFYKETKVDLMTYPEFVNNQYDKGDFLEATKRLVKNRQNSYSISKIRYDAYSIAKKQKEIFELQKELSIYNKIVDIKMYQYKDFLKHYFNIVHKKMIIEGYGYSFGHNIGTIVINRCHVEKAKRYIDYKATKEKEARLKAEGKRIYNKEEAEWCRKNNIEYIAEDKRVYTNKEYVYEVAYMYCTLKNASKLKLEISDYRSLNYAGITNEQLAASCNNDINKICELDVNLKTKLTICNSVDKTLYVKFIRNENQKPARAITPNS